jgi:Protein of unknown function (DUF1553)/Protein of unknown function (DUF1549)
VAGANPIDRLVVAPLQAKGITPSPQADRATLIRRLSLDLLGLPPTPEELRAFVADDRPEAYAELVNRLLASPHFGERWGRHWLDLARYADSDGYEKDSPRPFAWRYRNWVIDAINRDLPFDQFTIEQLAGDLLPNPTLDQRVATGFHRNTLTNKEGGVDQEEFRVAAVIDRVNTTSTVWLGLTVGCAQCHSHKYDPILMHEFYGLFAFFNQGNEVDIPAPLPSEAEAYEKAKQVFEIAHAPFAAAVAEFEKIQLAPRQAAWEQALDPATLPAWTPLEMVAASSTGKVQLKTQSDGSILATGENPATVTYTIDAKTSLKGVTAFRLEVLPDPSVPANGPGRAGHGNFVLSEFKIAVIIDGQPRPLPVAAVTADFSQDKYAVAGAADGDVKTGWAVSPQLGKPHTAAFETASDFELPEGATLQVVLDQQYGSQHTIGKFRLSASTMPRPVKLEGVSPEISAILATVPEQRSREQGARLGTFYASIDPELAKLRQAAAEHARQAPPFPATQAQAFNEIAPRRKTHIHVRGDFLRKGEEVQPHTLAVLHPFSGSGRNATRLDLARWIVDPANPLTARVTMNRIWKNLIGQALVASVEDFGTRGEQPSHPELFDWLASEFVSPEAKGKATPWSVKRMIKLIVMSQTYRQSSQPRPELHERDPRNVWLARQNRFRVEAEVVRDLSLAASGLLTTAVGGPSVRPKQPAGISELTYAGSARWAESTGADRFRRGLYTWFQRTSPYPMLMTFDAPESNVSCTRRDRSNTPLQALTLLNDPVFHECAQALGRRIQSAHPHDGLAQIKLAAELSLGRAPTADELQSLTGLLRELFSWADSNRAAAAKLVGTPAPSEADVVDVAAAIALARVILNLDEFVTRE